MVVTANTQGDANAQPCLQRITMRVSLWRVWKPTKNVSSAELDFSFSYCATSAALTPSNGTHSPFRARSFYCK